MSTTTTNQEILDKLAEQLMSGSYFARRWAIASTNEHCSYRPMIRPAQYGQLIEGIGRMATRSAEFATIAARMLASGFNLFGTASQIEQQVYKSAHGALAHQFDDVARRTGPEPCRISDAQRDWTLADRIRLAVWCEELLAPFATDLGTFPGIGWALRELAEANGVRISPTEFKRLG